MNPQPTLIEEDQGSARELRSGVSSPIVDGDLPDLDALEKVARAATQRAWFRSGGRNDLYDGRRPLNGHGICLQGDQDTIAHVFFDKQTGEGFADANHIAAFDPPTALALIASNRALTARVEALEADTERHRAFAKEFLTFTEGMWVDALPGEAWSELSGLAQQAAALQGVG